MFSAVPCSPVQQPHTAVVVVRGSEGSTEHQMFQTHRPQRHPGAAARCSRRHAFKGKTSDKPNADLFKGDNGKYDLELVKAARTYSNGVLG